MLEQLFIYLIFFGFGILTMYIIELYSNWSKWELVEENKTVSVVESNPIMGKISEGNMQVNVYKKINSKTGLEKFKAVPRI